MPPQSYRIRILPAAPGVPAAGFECPADLTVLRASLREGGGLLSSCRAGTCRACMRRLRSGQIEYLIEWPGLSAEERPRAGSCPAWPAPVPIW